MFIQTRYMSGTGGQYQIVRSVDAMELYKRLTAEYWNWIHEDACDSKNDKGYVTFLRDDSIGGPRRPGQKPPAHKGRVSIREGSNLFFPVYHVHICERDPHPKGGTCDNIDRCMEAAGYDLRQIEHIYADIEIKGGTRKPIPTDLRNHRVTLYGFWLNVPPNDLNREPDYHLNPGSYNGVVQGTYMYLKDFKKGTYLLYFGGVATNFETHSEYTVDVT
jgi:hypothetical protein